MDDDAEAGWERERQVAEAREARERALADCSNVLDMLAQREAAGPVSSWAPPAPEPVRRQPEPSAPRPVPPPSPPMPDKVQLTQHDESGRVRSITTFEGASVSAAVSWENWVKQYVARRIDAFAMSFGEGIGDVLREDVFGPYNAKIAALEARIAELERITGQGLCDAAD